MNVTEGAEGPVGSACWDNLYDGCVFASSLIARIKGGDSLASAPAILPPCVSSPWTSFLPTAAADMDTDESTAEEGGSARLRIECAVEFALPADVHDKLVVALGLLGTPAGGTADLDASSGADALSSWRNARFVLFDADAVGEAAVAYAASPAACKYLLGELVRDIVVFFKPLALPDGTRIGSVQLAASHALAVARLFGPEVHAEHGVVETLVLLLIQPAETSRMYLCAVLLELCKLAPSVVPPILASGDEHPCYINGPSHRLLS